MEAIKEHSAASGSAARASRLRYPLRSAGKVKDEKPTVADGSSPSASASASARRGRNASNVSKSVSVLDLSGKDKSGKPPRRLSIPAKSSASPLQRPFNAVTPIAESRAMKTKGDQTRIVTPSPNTAKTVTKQKFSVLSSVSYWLSQIKISECAGKHSISLGFFKLALESECEPMQKMRDVLKAYVRRHNLLELGEPTKELLRGYDIDEDLETLSISDVSSQVLDSSDEDGKSKPRTLDLEPMVKYDSVKKRTPATSNKSPMNRNSVNLNSAHYSAKNGQNMQKKTVRTKGSESKCAEKKSCIEQESAERLFNIDEMHQEDKENKEAQDPIVSSQA